MSKLILKLPAADQRQYTQYVTSAAVKADVATSRWDKFWAYMEQIHNSAVQASLMFMCDKPSNTKQPSAVV